MLAGEVSRGMVCRHSPVLLAPTISQHRTDNHADDANNDAADQGRKEAASSSMLKPTLNQATSMSMSAVTRR